MEHYYSTHTNVTYDWVDKYKSIYIARRSEKRNRSQPSLLKCSLFYKEFTNSQTPVSFPNELSVTNFRSPQKNRFTPNLSKKIQLPKFGFFRVAVKYKIHISVIQYVYEKAIHWFQKPENTKSQSSSTTRLHKEQRRFSMSIIFLNQQK